METCQWSTRPGGTGAGRKETQQDRIVCRGEAESGCVYLHSLCSINMIDQRNPRPAVPTGPMVRAAHKLGRGSGDGGRGKDD
eukprot:3465034-Rhodomonas_salina.1